MKKFLSLLLTIALIAQMLVVPVFAEENMGVTIALTPDTVSGKPGETVTMTLSLSGAANSSAIGITVDGNLVLNPDESQWLLDGTLADFSSEDNIASWATEAEDGADINGDIATLAFTIPYIAGEQETVSCAVTLVDPNNAKLPLNVEAVVNVLHNPAQSITLSESALSLDLAGTATAALSASILPEDTTDSFRWYSLDEGIAVVDENGNVTAVDIGETEIIAESVSSQDGGSTVSASCAVNVTCSHNFENYCCTFCGYSEPTDACVASVASPYGGNFYFTSLKAAVEFAHTIPRDVRPFVAVEQNCTIDETITISDGINIFSSVEGENRTITVTADTAFELTDRAFLLINYLDINTTGSYIFKITASGNGVQMSDTNLSGATKSAFYVPEGVERNGIQFYGGSISAYTAITMNGNQGGFTIAGGEVAINVSNPEGAFILNGSNYNGEAFGANVTNSAENGVVFSLSNTSNIAFPGGVTFNGVNNYWNPHYNQPDGKIIPNRGAAARVDATYYGNLYPAFEAASQILYTNEGGSVMEDAAVPITIIGDRNTAEHFPTLTANHPIELYIAGEQNRLLLENGGILNIAQETRLHNATIYVQNGAELSGEEYLNLEDNGRLIRESDLDANESYVAKIPYHDGTYLYFESLNEAIDTVMAVPVEARPPVHILRDCELTETVTLDSDLHIVPNYPSGDPAAPDVVAHTIYAGEGVDTMFNIGGNCFFIVDFTYFDAQGADYAFNITSADATLLLSGGNTTGAAKAAIHTTEDVHYESVQTGENANDPYGWSANIQLYGCEIEGDAAIILDGSGSYVAMAGRYGCTLTGSGDQGAIVFNGDDHVVVGLTDGTGIYAEDIAFTMNGNSTYMGGYYNGYFYNPGAEFTAMPCAGAAARVDLCYYGDLQDAFDLVSSVTDEIDDPNFALQIEILSHITVTDELVLEDAPYPVHLIMNDHTITVANGGTVDIRDDMVALLNGTIFVANGGTFEGYANTDHNSQIEYEPAPENPIAKIGDVSYASIDEALAYAKPGDTITLVDNAETSILTVTSGVTLNLGTYNLTADYVVAFKDAVISATPNAGRLIVPKGNLILSEAGTNEKGQSILPVWDPNNGNYVFSLFVANTGNDARGLFINEEEGRLFFQWKHQATGAINKGLMADNGSSDNDVSMLVRLQWGDEDGVAYQNYVFKDSFVQKVAGSFDYTVTLMGIDTLGIDLSTLVVTAMITTESGAEATGQIWTIENAK